MTTNQIPQVRIGAQVRIKATSQRGVIADHAQGRTWGILINGVTYDFSEAEFTVLE